MEIVISDSSTLILLSKSKLLLKLVQFVKIYIPKIEVFGICNVGPNASTPVMYNEYIVGGSTAADSMSGNQAMWVNGTHNGFNVTESDFAMGETTSYLIGGNTSSRYSRVSVINPSISSVSFYFIGDLTSPDYDNAICKYNYTIE